MIEGFGTTIDVILINGVLREGDQIIICSNKDREPIIVTTVRSLRTPNPVKRDYYHHKEIKAAQSIKISASGLDHAVAGTSLFVVGPNDDIEETKRFAMAAYREHYKLVMSRICKGEEGVYVQASTLGSLEVFSQELWNINVPVCVTITGPVQKKDVLMAGTMLKKNDKYGVILAFDVKVTAEAQAMADEVGVKIFSGDVIYHLVDQFKAHLHKLKEERKRAVAGDVVFPCMLKIKPNCVFNKKNPIILGVHVLRDTLKVGTPICVPDRNFIDIGRVASIKANEKLVDHAKKGEEVSRTDSWK